MKEKEQICEEVILVNENDKEIGNAEKIRAHVKGSLHRAFSIFIFDSDGRMLLQKRAREKYHSGGLWTNACCGHPRPGEKLEDAAHRRLREEMGFDCALQEVFHFRYEAHFENRLTENELDHVMIGKFDGEPKPDLREVEEWTFVSTERLKDKMEREVFTCWFIEIVDRVLQFLKAQRAPQEYN